MDRGRASVSAFIVFQFFDLTHRSSRQPWFLPQALLPQHVLPSVAQNGLSASLQQNLFLPHGFLPHTGPWAARDSCALACPAPATPKTPAASAAASSLIACRRDAELARMRAASSRKWSICVLL